jgi:hypothetical protein
MEKENKNNLKNTIIYSSVVCMFALTGVVYFLFSSPPMLAWKCSAPPANGTAPEVGAGASTTEIPLTYVAKGRNEYLVFFDTSRGDLVSNDTSGVPKQWLNLQGAAKTLIGINGFTTANTIDDAKTEVTFDEVSKKYIVKSGTETPYSEDCTAIDWDAVKTVSASAESGAPIEYLELRNFRLQQMVPKLGDEEFSRALITAINKNRGSDSYSNYHILSRLPPDKMTSIEKDQLEAAKKRLLSDSTQQIQVWESTGGYSFRNYPYNNSMQVGEACKNKSANISDLSSQGFKISSQSPADQNVQGGTCQGRDLLMVQDGVIPD